MTWCSVPGASNLGCLSIVNLISFPSICQVNSETTPPSSAFDGQSFAGYRVSVRLVREGLEEHEPAAISSPADVYSLMSGLKGSDRERMYSLHLDTKNRVLNCEEISCGTLFSPQIHPREVFKSAILTSSASIILVHNHPRDDPQPSPEDAAIPKKLSECGDILGIDRLDRIIIGEGSYYSFKEAGEMERYKGKN